jgi:hypothetical protein
MRAQWKGPIHVQGWDFYCPNCSTPRRVPYRPRPGNANHFLQAGLITAVLTLMTWPWFEIKGVVWFLPVWLVYETVYRIRLRAALACSNCGFDPYLYLTDINRARSAIDSHWRTKFQERGLPFPGDEVEVVEDGEEVQGQSGTPRAINAKQHAERQRSPALDA